jgi:3-oxoacyl-[acyl-carrier protein] reductase
VDKRFQSKHILITGAAGGMGLAFAKQFADEGAILILTDVDEPRLNQSAATLRGRGADCSVHSLDLTVENNIAEFGARICREYPRLDVLINNAGIAYGEITRGFETLSQEKWLRYFMVNSIAPLILAQALRPSLKTARGVILNVSSMASYVPATAYGVTKATLNAMTYGMANAFGAEGIRVNAIAPGIMETPAAVAELSPETYARVQGQQLLKLHGGADDIAELGIFLASDAARFITCEIVNCDAGNRMRGWRG